MIEVHIRRVGRIAYGIYRLHWKEGGSSLAAVGGTSDGTNWYAPINWTSDDNENPKVTSTDWSRVDYAEAIHVDC